MIQPRPHEDFMVDLRSDGGGHQERENNKGKERGRRCRGGVGRELGACMGDTGQRTGEKLCVTD